MRTMAASQGMGGLDETMATRARTQEARSTQQAVIDIIDAAYSDDTFPWTIDVQICKSYV